MSYTFLHRFPKVDTPFPLGRHIELSSSADKFVGTPSGTSVLHQHNTPVLNQKSIGGCTGWSMSQLLNCTMFAPCRLGKISLTDSDALALYSLATHCDGFGPDQFYPPHDSGSSGVGVAKAAIQDGYIDTYQSVTTFSGFQAAIEAQPVIIGVSWTNSMFNPSPDTGFITVGPLNDSTIAGGHEFLLQGIDYTREAVVMLNSWGNTWGGYAGLSPGQARISFSDFETLLAAQGDVIVPQSKKVTINV